jgi:hypothetical protein
VADTGDTPILSFHLLSALTHLHGAVEQFVGRRHQPALLLDAVVRPPIRLSRAHSFLN